MMVRLPSPTPSPAGDLIKITGNPKILCVGVVILFMLGMWALYQAHKDDKPGKNEGWGNRS